MRICWQARVRVNVKSQNDKDLFLVYFAAIHENDHLLDAQI